jgi:prepilin-type processing-associated H-X9-DG protein
VLLLPYIEQNNHYSLWDLKYPASTQTPAAYQTQPKLYLCPSRPEPVLSIGDFATPGGALTDYAASFGTEGLYTNSIGAVIPALPKVGVDAAGKPILNGWHGQLSIASITDGTSNTTLFGEKHIRPLSLRGMNEDRSVFGGNRNNIRRMMGISPNGNVRPLMPPNAQMTALANSCFGGPHEGVCQFVFCDGSVKPIGISVSLQTLTLLVTRNDGQVITENY